MDTATDTQPASGQVNLPNGGQVTSEQQSPEEKAGAMQSWMNTAGGSSPAKPPTQPQAAAGPGTATPAPQPAAQPVPVPVTSLKRGGILGVMDSVADVLVGKQKPELGKDPQGNLYIKEHTMTHGEQWARIAGEAMRGAAAGLAAGKGAGNMAKAPLAGMQAQEQAQTQEYDQMQKKVLDNANNQMLRMQMAEQSWKAGRLGVDAMEHDITFWQGQRDRLEKEGATYLGDTAHAGDISHLRAANPDIMKDLVENHSLEFIPKPGEDGKIQGFAVYKTPTKYGTDILPVGQEFPTYDNVKDVYQWHKTVTPITQKEYDDYWTSAGNAALKFRNDKKEGELKAAQKKNLDTESTARVAELPGKIADTAASAAEKRANASKVPSEIAKNWAEAHAADAKALDDQMSSGQGQEGEALVDSIGTGRTPVGRLAYILARKPELMAAVVKKYPDFDGSKVESYVKAYQDFTSGKDGIQYHAGGVALQHLANLESLNTPAAYIPGTPANTAYNNQATTLATELAKFYGDATIPAIKEIRDSLTGINRGKAITTQANSMTKKLNEFQQQWDDAAPSAVYEARMPRLAPEAEAARAHFDPKYREWLTNHQNIQGAAPAGMVTVQLPSGAQGQIPASNLDQFKQDNPGAQVVQ